MTMKRTFKSFKLQLSHKKSVFMVILFGLMTTLAGCQSANKILTTASLGGAQPSLARAISGDKNLASLGEAVRQSPDNVDAITMRGEAYAQKGRFSEAIADFTKVIALKPNHAPAYVHRGDVYLQLKQPDKALLDYNLALQLSPNNYAAYLGRGRIYQHQKQTNLALVDLEKAIDLMPDHPSAYYQRGLIRQYLGQHDKAIGDLDIAISLRPNTGGPYYDRGRSRMVKGLYKLAYNDFFIAAKGNKKHYKAWFFRGHAAEKMGDSVKAIRAYRRALSINPSFTPAGKALTRLGSDNDAA